MVDSTQQSVDIAGIKNGIIIMRDGSYRMVLQTSPVNFALKSEQEQTSLIFQYQSFLNSLHFPIEIIIRSKRLDLTPYLRKIEEITKKETNELIRIQAQDYTDFVKQLINIANIMKKSFFVTISYNPVTVRQVNMMDRLFGNKNNIYDHIKISDEEFKNCTDKLKERANIVASGLGGMGLHCFQLSTEELIELFYQVYNPDESSKERIEDMSILASPIIASEDEAPNTPGNKDENGQIIDNSQIVEEKMKQDSDLRKQEIEKDAERTERMPSAEPAASQPPVPQQPEQPVTNTAPIPEASLPGTSDSTTNQAQTTVAATQSPPTQGSSEPSQTQDSQQNNQLA